MDAVQLPPASKCFGEKRAVDDLGFDAPRGCIHGFIALPNGSGKTTTRRMIMSILRPDIGEVRILDKLNPSAATTVASVWAAAKISRNGILMQGKAARPTELRCWITAK